MGIDNFVSEFIVFNDEAKRKAFCNDTELNSMKIEDIYSGTNDPLLIFNRLRQQDVAKITGIARKYEGEVKLSIQYEPTIHKV